MSGKQNMCIILTAFCLKGSLVFSAPLLQLLQPYQSIAMRSSQQNLQQQNLQQQLIELQSMQQFNPTHQYALNPLQPFIVLIPDPANPNVNMIPKISDRIADASSLNKDKTKTQDGEEDSVVVNAEPMPILEEQKAFLVIPNGRFSIGGLISAIPFLPIEINVPDTITWAYNGISSGISDIIAIIGSRFPFQGPQEGVSMKNINVKSILNEMQITKRNNIRPLVIMPLGDLRRPFSPFIL